MLDTGHMKPSTLALTVPVGLALLACASEDPGPGEDTVCEDGHCDGLPFADQLKGREDPAAKWLRSLHDAKVIDDQGVYDGSKADKIKWISLFNTLRNNWAHEGTKEKGLNKSDVDFLLKVHSMLGL